MFNVYNENTRTTSLTCFVAENCLCLFPFIVQIITLFRVGFFICNLAFLSVTSICC